MTKPQWKGGQCGSSLTTFNNNQSLLLLYSKCKLRQTILVCRYIIPTQKTQAKRLPLSLYVSSFPLFTTEFDVRQRHTAQGKKDVTTRISSTELSLKSFKWAHAKFKIFVFRVDRKQEVSAEIDD